MENETVSQWVDADNVRALAEELMKPAAPPAPVTPEAIYGSGFVGFAEPDADPSEPSATAPIPDQLTAQPRKEVSSIKPGDTPAPQSPKPATQPKRPTEVSASTPSESQIKVAAASVVQPVLKKDLPGVRDKSKDSDLPIKQPEPAGEVVNKVIFTPPQPTPLKATETESKSVPEEEVELDEPVKSPPGRKSALEVSAVDHPKKLVPLDPKPPVDSVPPKEVTVTPTVNRQPVVHKQRFKSPFRIVTSLEEARGESQGTSATSNPAGAPVSKKAPLLTRLSAFGDWLKAQVPAESYFICELNGEVLVDEVGSSKLINVARMLASSSAGSRPDDSPGDSGGLHVRVSAEKVMEVIPRESHFGSIILGVIVPRPLSRDAAASVGKALGEALAES